MITEQLKLEYSNYSTKQLLDLHNQLQKDLETFGDYNNYFSSLNYYYIKRINIINYLLKGKGAKQNEK